ncbi:MAG: hypothetical protein MI717_04860 [Spirochaetales bacterium]|nr:hypothetical protein [Spirochaetales bacterium]
MKRVSVIALILFVLCTVGAFAQQFPNESELYPKSLQIAKIYNHSKGYRIDYIRQDYTVGTFWAPVAWFREAGGIGEIAYGEGESYPYVSFFYKDGQMDHFRLYLFRNLAHESWGFLDPTIDYDGEFPANDALPEISFTSN